MLNRTGIIPEIQLAQNAKVSMRKWEVGRLCEGRLITRACLRELSPAPLQHTQFVIAGRLFRIQLQGLVQAGLCAIQVAGSRRGQPEQGPAIGSETTCRL